MKTHISRLFTTLVFAAFAFAACAEEDKGGEEEGGEPCELVAGVPAFGAAVFTTPTVIDNTFFPLTPGDASVHRLVVDGEIETAVSEVTTNTPTVNGVVCREVQVREYLDDLLIEDTLDWYAQDDDGNVWYFGEDVVNYVYDDNDNLIGTNTNGSWEAGLDVALTGSNAIAGIIMPGTPAVGFTYYQEYYLTEAEDIAQVFALSVSVTLTDGRNFTGCLQTLECNPLEEDSHEYKYYAPGLGLIREEAIADGEFTDVRGHFLLGASNVPNFGAAVFGAPTTINNTRFPLTVGDSYIYRETTEDGTEVIVVDVLNQTQMVNGINCREVRDRVYLDGRLIEDTFDWYAQDNTGNVWYMGEFVTNYQYDAAGALIGSNNDGSWEAGVSGALPGIQMLAAPAAGTSYEQEYWAGQAEDGAQVLSTTATVTLSNGSVYMNCVQTIDWNLLDPVGLEYKYYASGIGMVLEQHVDEPDVAELTGKTP